jgi:hypothetical protein
LRVTEASPAGKFSQPVGTVKTLPVLSLRLLSELVIKKLRVSVGIYYFRSLLRFFDSVLDSIATKNSNIRLFFQRFEDD